MAIEKRMIPSLLKRFKNLLGVGPYLLLLGLLFEGLTIAIRQWISFHIPLTFEMQVILSVPCISICLLGMIWFNHSLNLIKINFLDAKNTLISHGPFNYVRHPLYSTLLITIPPLMIIWLSDLLFLIPWVLLFILSHYVVLLEERGLIMIFGEDYETYRRFVPPLLPYKGAGGRLYREHCDKSTQEISGKGPS
ncbi:Protein-S-isoprenylcysteine O-methyltransferase Ste14 [Methanophagales archaeon]|nr:Protein-S-isoprenylcysteine O-methyltransferase Ste14 [Methanophagales archaeon]